MVDKATCQESVVRRRLVERYQRIVDHCDAVALANLGQLRGVAELCVTAGVGGRTLLRAFRVIRNATPSHHLRLLRLNEVRQALLAADAGSETVTRIANRFGVRELGRFAVDYRTMFGESPSDTLGRRPRHDGVIARNESPVGSKMRMGLQPTKIS